MFVAAIYEIGVAIFIFCNRHRKYNYSLLLILWLLLLFLFYNFGLKIGNYSGPCPCLGVLTGWLFTKHFPDGAMMAMTLILLAGTLLFLLIATAERLQSKMPTKY
jgi:hypothetical protein